MSEFVFLDKINSPEELKKLSLSELEILCDEIRRMMIDTVSRTGGHLASNLGVVELTVALHWVFDSPCDQIVWDVGHQSYTHKILTGRKKDFSTLRQENGLSGFTRPNESPHDIFYSGHSSTSLSSAFGLSKAKALNGDDHYVVAVIGDGALTGGLAYEALNNAGRTKSKFIVILNDNKMSISRNVGSVPRHLAIIRSKPAYFKMKAGLERFLDRIPYIGKRTSRFIFRTKTTIKNILYKSTLFEDMGFAYLGPIDGHNLHRIMEAMEGAKTIGRPVLLHISTIKGKGYSFAEENPKQFHGISQFDIETGDFKCGDDSFSDVFGRTMCRFAAEDKSLCCITAAMTLGTGLTQFGEQYRNRFFDVGIAEEHAVTFASGLAKNGMRPVFAVYSTFLQRSYDQLIHDAALQNQRVVLAVDRAGFVGEDGETHQGLFDASFLSGIPGIRILSPCNFEELEQNLHDALYRFEGVTAIRYPRGTESSNASEYEAIHAPYALYGDMEADDTIVTYGRIFAYAYGAMEVLRQKGIVVRVLKLNQIKPLDDIAVEKIIDSRRIFFFEEGMRAGGIGEHFAAKLMDLRYKGEYKLTAVEDTFVAQAPVPKLLKKYKLDETGIVETVLEYRGDR